MNTKEKIIYESLNLFSMKGYSSTSIRDIASSVGIKGSSIYNHFKNKHEILNTIIERYSDRLNNFFYYIKKDNDTNDNINNIIVNKLDWLCDDQYFTKILTVFRFYLEDEYIVKFRKLLLIEQFNNSKIANLFNKLFIDNMLDYQVKIFKKLMDLNILAKRDPDTLALQFYSPLFLAFSKCEIITDEEIKHLNKHVIEFKNTYTIKG